MANGPNQRCEAAVVQLIVTEYDEHGRPVGEQVSASAKVFRAVTRDFWAEADKAVAAMKAQQRAAPQMSSTTATTAKLGKKR